MRRPGVPPPCLGGREECTVRMNEQNGRLEQGAATGARMASAVKDRAEWLGGKMRTANLKDTAHLKDTVLMKDASVHLKDTSVHVKDTAVHLKDTVVEHAGPWAAKVRETAPKLAARQGKRAKEIAGDHPKGTLIAGVTAFGVLLMARLRRMMRASSQRKRSRK